MQSEVDDREEDVPPPNSVTEDVLLVVGDAQDDWELGGILPPDLIEYRSSLRSYLLIKQGKGR